MTVKKTLEIAVAVKSGAINCAYGFTELLKIRRYYKAYFWYSKDMFYFFEKFNGVGWSTAIHFVSKDEHWNFCRCFEFYEINQIIYGCFEVVYCLATSLMVV